MAGHKAHQLSPARCVAFALWAVDHAEMAQDPEAVKVAMRVTEPQARVLCRALVEARKRPGRKPKARVVRRFQQRLQRQADDVLQLAQLGAAPHQSFVPTAELQQLIAERSAAACKPRCRAGFATCSNSHLSIGESCDPGQCRVKAGPIA